MLFVVPPDKRAEVMKALSDYRVEEVKVDPFGARGAYAEDYRNGGEREGGRLGGGKGRRWLRKTL